MHKGYNQFCPVAKASEILANRWTPLILRELMHGMRAFNDIHRGVPLISRAVLVARLRELEDQGVVERRPRPDRKGCDYALTAAGDALRSVVSALGHWGLVHARERITPADLDPAVLMWALRKRTDARALPGRRVVAQFEFLGVPASYARTRIMWLVLVRGDVDVCAKNPGFPIDVVLRGRIADFVALYLGHASWRELAGGRIAIEGERAVARRLPAWLRLDKVVGRDLPIVPPAAA